MPDGSPLSTLALCGGGSGGHLFPALAVLEELKQRPCSPARVMILHPGRAIDQQVLADHEIEPVPLSAPDSGGLKRKPVASLRTLWTSVRQARRLFRERRPDCVIGIGGGGSLPGVLAARREQIPIVLLEQNVVPGRATSLLCRWADAVCVSFDETLSRLPRSANTIVTGNPVRSSIAQLAGRPPATERRTLLILGGSQGAGMLNRATCLLAQRHPELFAGWQVIHQTGRAEADHVRGIWQDVGIEARVASFFDDMNAVYRETALAISRAGATSLAEFACAGMPAILVPNPNSIRDHQRINAGWYAERNGAVTVNQPATPEELATSLAKELKRLLQEDAHRESMQGAMRDLAQPDAAARVVDVLHEVLQRHGRTGECGPVR
jgi:UDP-N-acetylglucosamine--N-acetylmuramyl-(pentapeptide) pyrophosphoryl-undecaprenol N-acetylglucosamine transferase